MNIDEINAHRANKDNLMRTEGTHPANKKMDIHTFTPEETLAEDQKAENGMREELKEIRHRRSMAGGGKESRGFAGRGASDEEIAAKEKEIKDHEAMAQQQYLLGKKHGR